MSRYYDDELVHFGILGMKWGVRRFQNKDGSLTSEGEQRYLKNKDGSPISDGGQRYSKKKNKSVRQLKLEDNFQKKGYSKEEAEALARRRIRTEKIIAAAAITTVAGIAAYKYYTDNVKDVVVGSKDTPLLRVQAFDGVNNKSGAVYAAYDNKDNIMYKGNWAGVVRAQAGRGKDIYNMEITRKEHWLHENNPDGFKIASDKHAKKLFNSLYKTNPEFKDLVDNSHTNVKDMLKKTGMNADASPAIRKITNSKTPDYEAFNIELGFGPGGSKNKDSKAAKMFYEYMKKNGYDGVKDINDNKFSGYADSGKSAVLLFNDDYNWKAHKLSDIDLRKYADEAYKIQEENNERRIAKSYAKSMAINAATFGGAAAATSAYTKKNVVNSYRKDHPNTELTDNEIYYNYMKDHKKKGRQLRN